jgi:hypothetical protein
VHEIIADKQERFTQFCGQSIGKAISEIEAGGVARALSKPIPGRSGQFDLLVSDSFDDNLESRD